MSTPGAVIAGKFRLEEVIGRGGMGTVWRARHMQLDMPVAVKLMEGAAADAPDARQRFEREARAAAQIRSPFVVQILDHGVDDDAPYIVMELLEGEDLGVRLRRVRRVPLQALEIVIAQTAKGLRRAHELGIVHRDLKPSNIFLARVDDEESVKLLDFGVAKLRWTGAIGDFTQAGTLLGSPSYMSPEQARGNRAVDHRSDLWSLAVIAFRGLTGVKPFEGDSIGDLIVKLCIDPPPVASRIDPTLPPAIDDFFARAFEQEPDRRFQSALELAAAFTAIARSSAPAVKGPANAESRPTLDFARAPTPGPPDQTPMPPPAALPPPSARASSPGAEAARDAAFAGPQVPRPAALPPPSQTPPSNSQQVSAEELLRGRAVLSAVEMQARAYDNEPPLPSFPGPLEPPEDVAPWLAGGLGGPAALPPGHAPFVPRDDEAAYEHPAHHGAYPHAYGPDSTDSATPASAGGAPTPFVATGPHDTQLLGYIPPPPDSKSFPGGTLNSTSLTLPAPLADARRLIAWGALGATITAALVVLIVLLTRDDAADPPPAPTSPGSDARGTAIAPAVPHPPAPEPGAAAAPPSTPAAPSATASAAPDAGAAPPPRDEPAAPGAAPRPAGVKGPANAESRPTLKPPAGAPSSKKRPGPEVLGY